MKIKTKLRLGFGFLFIVILAFGALGILYLNRISENSRLILKDNYESLHYVNEMERILSDNPLPLGEQARKEFLHNLELESKNSTEKGEGELVERLRATFVRLSQRDGKYDLAETRSLTREILHNIRILNMKAIEEKNEKAEEAIGNATLYLGLIASFTFLILFSFIVNFPGYIANPLREFSAAIREISTRNYKQRLNFRTNDEFAELASAFNEMAARLDDWEHSNLAQIKSEKLRIETIIEQMQDAIIGVNEGNEILFVNKIGGEILNLQYEEMKGRNATDLAKENDLMRALLSAENAVRPIKIVVDGKELFFKLERRDIVIPAPDRGNVEDKAFNISKRSAGRVFILRNITEFKELDEAKTNFIATVSHELKTPIASIRMSLKLLGDPRVGALNKEQGELLSHIREDTDRLLKITSELLDLSQVETGNIQLSFTRTDPMLIVNYAIGTVRLQAEQKEVGIELVSRRELPYVIADMEKTAWVLINFLSNALRYSHERSRIIVEVLDRGHRVEFSVRDFGKGIEERYLSRLFDRYFRVPSDGSDMSGSGLGLSISKDFIEAQNGNIWVESSLGEGSKFGFSLPAAEE